MAIELGMLDEALEIVKKSENYDFWIELLKGSTVSCLTIEQISHRIFWSCK